MESWLVDYINLAFKIDQVLKNNGGGLIESYRGPKDIIAKGMRRGPSIKAIRDEGNRLLDNLFEQDISLDRKYFIEKQLYSMQSLIDIITEPEEFDVLVNRCLDIELKWVDDRYFEEGLYSIKQGLSSNGTKDDFIRWKMKNQFVGSYRDKKDIIDRCYREIENRTKQVLKLPDNEKVDLQLKNEPGMGGTFNYLGDYKSRVILGMQAPLDLIGLLPLLCHETYPGHHTEYCIRDDRYGDDNPELFLATVLSPQLVISEGLAENAFEFIFDYEDASRWLSENIFSQIAFKKDDIDIGCALRGTINNSLDQLSNNIVIMMENKEKPKDIYEYVKKYSIEPNHRINTFLNGLSNRYMRLYALTYYNGKQIVKGYIKSHNNATNGYYEIVKGLNYPSLLKRKSIIN